ncbi:MAG: AraC family transcriptional regulator [Anaerolineales bacterium]
MTVLNQMFLYLDSLKVDIDEFLCSTGLDPTAIKSPDAYLPIETYLLIQDEAAHYVGDPYFGLHMGEYAEPGSWSILGYMMMNCRTLAEAFEKSARYQRIIGNLITGEAHLRLNKIKVVLSTPPHAPNEPESTAEYERIFRCPVLFGQKENSFTIPLSIVFTPIKLPNPELLQYFENYAQEFLAEMDRQNEYTNAVTKIILAHLDDEDLTIKKVAKELSVSVRTLQNRLGEEGVIFSELLQEIRERLAKKYLRENYTVANITYLLGFSEPSVFRKSFKRWSGVTPREYRESTYTRIS